MHVTEDQSSLVRQTLLARAWLRMRLDWLPARVPHPCARESVVCQNFNVKMHR